MLLLCYGTRPELIKLFPLMNEFKKQSIHFKTLFTGQHKHLIKDYEDLIEPPSYTFDIFKAGQSLDEIYSKILVQCHKLFSNKNTTTIKCVIVQGDTTSGTAIAHSAFHHKIPVAHIEAGLRTGRKYSPFPEEINRSIISRLATFHFAPTKEAYSNLIKENINKESIFLVGNTIADAVTHFQLPDKTYNNYILITLHRRENWGIKMTKMLTEINQCAENYPKTEFKFIYHPNSKELITEILKSENISILPPQNYKTFIHLIAECRFLITDSGGIQEEAMCLGKILMICRDTTERPEVISNHYGKLVKTDILDNFEWFYDNYQSQHKNKSSIYGSNVSRKIVSILQEHLSK